MVVDIELDLGSGIRNPHEVALENEYAVLKLLRNFGHLRRQDIALGVWPNSSVSSAEQMVRRTMQRLLDKKLVLDRRNSYASDSFVLSRNGANLLLMDGLDALPGYNIQSVNGPQFYHRTLGNVFLLKKMGLGFEALSEYALLQKWSPLTRTNLAQRFKKMPDGLLLKSGSSLGLTGVKYVADWVEVESTYKPKEELQKVLDMGWRSGEWLNTQENILLDKLYIVYNSELKNHEGAILKALESQIKEKPVDNLDDILDCIVLVSATIKLPLKWVSHEERTALDFIKGGRK